MDLDLRQIEREIEGGLSNERHRMESARENIAYYEGQFEEYRYHLGQDHWDDGHVHRSTYLVGFVIRKLTEHLYKHNPARIIRNSPAAASFLNAVYADQSMFAKWQSADRLSTVAQVAAFQVAGTPDPMRPVKIHLWDASQFTVWTNPDDPLVPAAVCTKEVYDCQRRYTLWTADQCRVYMTRKTTPGQTSGGTAATLVSSLPNPYGVIPFSYVHFDFPTTKFWTEGPGDVLREANDNLNSRLTQLAAAVRYTASPIGWTSGIDPEYEPQKPYRPGVFLTLAPDSANPLNNGTAGKIGYLEANPEHITKQWDDIHNFIQLTLDTMGIPEAAYRFIASAGRSGDSIKAEQTPLLQWAQGRQSSFAHYEADLAKLVLQVASSHLSNNGVPNQELERALEDFQFEIRWHPLFSDGEARNREDTWDLQNGLTSRIQIVMRRYSMSRDEAIAYLKQVDTDTQAEAEFLAPPQAVAPPTGTTGGSEIGDSSDVVDESSDGATSDT